MDSLRGPCRHLLALSLVLALVATVDAHARAADQSTQSGVPIAIVDVQRLMHDSLAGQAIENQMQKLRSAFSAKVSKKESALRQEEKDLAGQVSILAPDVFADRRRQFEDKVAKLQRDVHEQQQALEQTYAAGIGQIRQTIVEILQGLIEKRHIALVMPRTAILVGSRSLDITDEVLSQLNKRLPTVTLTPPSGNSSGN